MFGNLSCVANPYAVCERICWLYEWQTVPACAQEVHAAFIF